jgi:hypothetical protein
MIDLLKHGVRTRERDSLCEFDQVNLPDKTQEALFERIRRKPKVRMELLKCRLSYSEKHLTGGFHPGFCVYCGDFAQCRDHVEPITVSSVYRDYNNAKTVDCCHQCNSAAGQFWAKTIIEKAEYLLGRYSRRYAKLMREPHWEDCEIEQLGWSLRQKITARENLRRIVELKLENLECSASGFMPKPFWQNTGFLVSR